MAGGVCPECGWLVREEVAARLGYCDRCHDFTGMCGAGRKVICPDMMSMTTWHTPCTQRGVARWDITLEYARHVTMLCEAHDAQVRSGAARWIRTAVPVERRGRQVG